MTALIRLALLSLGLLTLAGCGARKDLKPAPGMSLPPAPYGAAKSPGTGDLLASPPEARPDRSDEALRDSQDRAPDPYDLPPTG